MGPSPTGERPPAGSENVGSAPLEVKGPTRSSVVNPLGEALEYGAQARVLGSYCAPDHLGAYGVNRRFALSGNVRPGFREMIAVFAGGVSGSMIPAPSKQEKFLAELFAVARVAHSTTRRQS